jgi:hypothetical protein
MLDTLLNIGCAFDWITPSIAFINDLLCGPPGDFGIPANPYWGRREIKRLLRGNGVRVWGLMYNFSGDLLMFTVSKQQAGLTFYLLQEQGIPILYAPAEFFDVFDDGSA